MEGETRITRFSITLDEAKEHVVGLKRQYIHASRTLYGALFTMNGPLRVYAKDELEAFVIITKWIKAGSPRQDSSWRVPEEEEQE